MPATSPEPSTPIEGCFSRHGEHGKYATIPGRGGLTGHYTHDLNTIAAGDHVGLYNAHFDRSVIGVVRDAQHKADTVTFRFHHARFRVLHGTEPVTADSRSYLWHSPATATHLHAVVHPSDTASPPYTRRYEPIPGRSLAFVDVTGHGGPSDEWLFGAPYHSSNGTLAPWCQHCGLPATAPTSPGETAPYFDVAEGQTPPACRDGRTHHPVYIWTPYGHACAAPSQNIALTNDHHVHDGKPPLDPFDATSIDEACTFALTEAIEWFDAALNGREFVEEVMRPALDR